MQKSEEEKLKRTAEDFRCLCARVAAGRRGNPRLLRNPGMASRFLLRALFFVCFISPLSLSSYSSVHETKVMIQLTLKLP